MSTNLTYDLAIIGWGKAGKTIAAKAAAAGKRVAIIEQSPTQYGGTCINVACLPTKSLVHAAHLFAQARTTIGELDPDAGKRAWRNAQAHRETFVSMLRNKNFHLLADLSNVDTFTAQASFVDQHTLALQDAQGTTQLSATTILINTGARTRPLDVPGYAPDATAHSRIHTSDTLLALPELPQSLGIIGAGFIGLEFASLFANFGTKVTVFTPEDRLLSQLDDDVAQSVVDALNKQHITIVTGARITGLTDAQSATDAHASIAYTQDGQATQANFEQVLVAVGRVPNTQGLALENAGVELDERGAIRVDEQLKTTADNIYAAGDVKGGPQFTFISFDDARILAASLGLPGAAKRTLNDRPVFATTTFLEPPLAQVGLSEKSAQDQGLAFTVKKLPTAGIPKAHVIGETAGLNKVLVAEDGHILGAVLQNPEAGEMINLIAFAMQEHIPASSLASMIYTHPTFTESLNDLLK